MEKILVTSKSLLKYLLSPVEAPKNLDISKVTEASEQVNAFKTSDVTSKSLMKYQQSTISNLQKDLISAVTF